MTEWFYSEFGQTKGPVSESNLINKVLDQELELDSYVTDGINKPWKKIKDIPVLLDKIHEPEDVPHNVVFEADFINDDSQVRTGNLFFYIPIRRFVIMNILSLGIYQIYWFYKQWFFWAKKHKQAHRSFDREAGWLLFPLMLFEKIETDKELNAVYRANFNGKLLFWAWILFGGVLGIGFMSTKGNNPLYLILSGLGDLFAIVFLLPIQIYINKVNAKLGNTYEKPGLGHYLCIAAGIAFVLVSISMRQIQSQLQSMIKL